MTTQPRDFEIVDDPAVLRVLGHPERLAIMRRLMDQPKTGTTVAAELGMPATRAHYHLQQLLKAGLIVDVNRAAGMVKKERHYLAQARHLIIDPALVCTSTEAASLLRQSAELTLSEWRRREVLRLDLGEVASLLVQDCLRVQPGEQVFLEFMPPGLELAEAVQVELDALQARSRVKFWSQNFVTRTLERHAAEAVGRLPFIHPADMEQITAGIFISTSVGSGRPPSPAQLEKLAPYMATLSQWYALLRQRRVRHVEVILPQRGDFFDHPLSVEQCMDLYWRAIVGDARLIRRRAAEVIAKIGHAGHWRLTSASGTDLVVDVSLSNPHVGDGVVTGADLAAGHAYDRLPAGPIVFLPAGDSAAGTLHVEYTSMGGDHFRDLTLTLKSGRIVNIQGSSAVDGLRDAMARSAGDVDRLAFLAIGVDGQKTPMTGKTALDMGLLGNVTVSFGNNEVYGGSIRSTRDILMLAGNATIHAGDHLILHQGALELALG